MPWKISSPLDEESRNLNLSEQNQSARRWEGLSIRGSTVLRKKDTGSNIKETFGESPRMNGRGVVKNLIAQRFVLSPYR